MSLSNIQYCPSTLQSGFNTYSPAAQLTLFGSRSKKVSHVLPFTAPGINAIQTQEFNEKRKRISISGVQEKYSLKLEKNELLLTDTAGTHILKPIPAERLDRVGDLSANEHLTMQISTQIFGIKTAANGMIFFEDGSPAYITRRFDYKPNSREKYLVEDFATLLAKSPEKEDHDFKYNASYLDIAEHIRRYCAATPVVLLGFFRLLLFNYLIANGDAHLKNFSLMETDQGDFVLSPAYDLLCTALHLNDSPLALHGGLYEKDYEEAGFATFGCYTASSFKAFAKKAGVADRLANREIERTLACVPGAIELVKRSFLSDDGKAKYISMVEGRKNCLLLNS